MPVIPRRAAFLLQVMKNRVGCKLLVLLPPASPGSRGWDRASGHRTSLCRLHPSQGMLPSFEPEVARWPGVPGEAQECSPGWPGISPELHSGGWEGANKHGSPRD